MSPFIAFYVVLHKQLPYSLKKFHTQVNGLEQNLHPSHLVKALVAPPILTCPGTWHQIWLPAY